MKRLLATGLAAGLLLAGCTNDGDPNAGNRPAGIPFGGGVIAAGTLVQFDACEPLLEHLQAEALERVTPWGLPGGGGWWGGPIAVMEDDVAFAEPFSAAPQASRSSGELVAGQDFSTTNIQEAGVDEPDVMKTDGEILVAVVQQVLRVVDLTGHEPVEVASMRLPDDLGNPQLLLAGERLLVVGQRWGTFFAEPLTGEDRPAALTLAPQSAITLVQLIDLSNPADPDIVADLELDGTALSSRLVDGIIHLVVSSQPTGLVFEGPTESGVRGERDALARNREVIRDSTIEDWLPAYAHRDEDGDEAIKDLVDCSHVHAPDEFAGFGTLSIVSVDPANDELHPRSAAGVLSEGQTVYGSPERLYVATTDWVDWGSLEGDDLEAEARDVTTDIHAFDITRPQVTYVGSGTAPGSLLNQFSMSEHDGHLRVATTEGNGWWAGEDSVSTVTTFAITGDELEEAGSVTGLGVTERIFAVRFLGDVGYVVTFRQVDPLYVVDLSDPAAPAVTGELKIPGYSAYLHPVGDGRLIGVGQDATDAGRVTGLQVSLFDVSDPADPQRLAHVVMPNANSESEWNHHAFLHWPMTGTTVLPMQQYGVEAFEGDVAFEEEVAPEFDDVPEFKEFFNGAIVLDVQESGIDIEGRISHVTGADDEWLATIQRSFVRNDVLWTLSNEALVGVDLATLDARHRLDW
ncbi:MAG: beta-propeller domain-containing protein [Nitriliruptorales bacterium]|nr:beta-propeller domain-containing protein [Nitriliruptorales bacterium]